MLFSIFVLRIDLYGEGHTRVLCHRCHKRSIWKMLWYFGGKRNWTSGKSWPVPPVFERFRRYLFHITSSGQIRLTRVYTPTLGHSNMLLRRLKFWVHWSNWFQWVWWGNKNCGSLGFRYFHFWFKVQGSTTRNLEVPSRHFQHVSCHDLWEIIVTMKAIKKKWIRRSYSSHRDQNHWWLASHLMFSWVIEHPLMRIISTRRITNSMKKQKKFRNFSAISLLHRQCINLTYSPAPQRPPYYFFLPFYECS